MAAAAAEGKREKSAQQVSVDEMAVLRSASFQSLYANFATVGFGPWDVRLTFSLIHEGTPKKLANEELVTIVMNRKFAQAVARLLQTNLDSVPDSPEPRVEAK